MKTRTIIQILIFASAFWPLADTYACCQDPDATMTVSATTVCVGSSVTFDANGSSDPDCSSCSSCGGVTMINGIRKFEWDWTDNGSYDHSESPGDGKASHPYSTAESYTCRVRVTDDDDDCCCDGSGCEDHTDTTTRTIRVVKVDKVVMDGYSDEGPLYLCVDGSVVLRAEPYPSGSFPTGEPHWTIESQPTGADADLSSDTGATTTLSNLTKPGDYEIKAKCGSSDAGDTIIVTTVEVASVGQSATEECSGESITFTATASPSGKPLDCIQWQKQYRADSTDEWGDWESASGYDPNAVLTTSTSGQYRYRARNGSADDWETSGVVSIVKVDWIQYDDPDTGWTNIQPFPSFALYVRKGTTVTFKATPEPDGASWPSGKPVWGGTAGASGTGSTESVTFNTLSSSTSDYKTVTAEDCGSTVTIYVVVFEFEGVFTPEDDFDDRATEYYGLEEKVALSFETDPWSVPANQAGGLKWTKLSGVGTLTNVDEEGNADYDAEETDGVVGLRLTIMSGPSKDEFESYGKTIIKPSGTRMTRVNPSNVWHVKNTASAGIKLYYWLDPKNVSFKYLTFGEGTCPATGATGIFVTIGPHAQNTFGAILGGNDATGCRVEQPDYAGVFASPWGSGGTFTWSIPTEYIDDTATRHSFGTGENHVPTVEPSGYTTISKGGQSDSAAAGDENSGY